MYRIVWLGQSPELRKEKRNLHSQLFSCSIGHPLNPLRFELCTLPFAWRNSLKLKEALRFWPLELTMKHHDMPVALTSDLLHHHCYHLLYKVSCQCDLWVHSFTSSTWWACMTSLRMAWSIFAWSIFVILLFFAFARHEARLFAFSRKVWVQSSQESFRDLWDCSCEPSSG